jgi:RNA polymerase-binding transcription factor DksA
VIARIKYGLAWLLSRSICEPKLRLGRRRHDDHCDECGAPIGKYALEKLDFPIDTDDLNGKTRGEKLRAMTDAEYVRYCLECGDELEEQEADSA